jgi:hypothetical protein
LAGFAPKTINHPRSVFPFQHVSFSAFQLLPGWFQHVSISAFQRLPGWFQHVSFSAFQRLMSLFRGASVV